MPKLRQEILILKNGLHRKSVFCLCFSFFALCNHPWQIHKRPRDYEQRRKSEKEIFFAEHRREHVEHGVIVGSRKEEKIRTEPPVHKVNRHRDNRKQSEDFRQAAVVWAKAVCQKQRRVHHEHDMHACGMKVHTVEHGKVVPCGHKQGYGSSWQA